jgi:hypothetical protein
MLKKYTKNSLLYITLITLLVIVSCKKDNTTKATTTSTTTTTTTPPGAQVSLGVYEEADSIYKTLFMVVAQVGTVTLNSQYNGLIFDTGSGGLVLDAHDILPAAMITTTGFNFTGDSTVVDGITITNQTSTIEYGDDNATDAIVYGNLAYASVVIGEPADKTITVQRVPFFLYYKSTQAGKALPTHEFDVLGVNSEFDKTFSGGVSLGSPFAYYNPGTGFTKGFKMSALGTGNFSTADEIPLTTGVITVGLSAADIASTSGYKFTTLTYNATDGAVPVLTSTIAYNGNSVSGYVVFDTGTDPYNYLEDNSAATTTTQLAAGSAVSITTTPSEFNYPFTVSTTDYLTYVENPSVSGTNVSILSLEFFLNNGYLIDYPDHKLGLN